MVDKETIGLLKETRRVIAREGWAQGSYYGRYGGYCLLGVVFDQVEGEAPLEDFARALGFSSSAEATMWNDNKSRTAEEVLARLDAAIQGSP